MSYPQFEKFENPGCDCYRFRTSIPVPESLFSRRMVTLRGRRKALPVFPRYFKHTLDFLW